MTTDVGEAPRSIRVLCVDDSADITTSLGICIDHERDMEIVGALQSAKNLIHEVKERRPDVVLLDMTMPGSDPLSILRALSDEGGSVRVIVFSGRDDEEAVHGAAAAGACGYLSKDAQISAVLGAIRAAARGDAPFALWR